MGCFKENAPKLGFGLMRLPKDEKDNIDVEQVKEMVDLFMDAGFTYFDTAWGYTGSEEAIRQALVERYPRDSFTIATKNAPWINPTTAEAAREQLDTSLKRLGTDYIDYYLLHNLGEDRSRYFDDFGMWEWIAEKKGEGKIRHMGFSFHSTPEELEEILCAHPEMEFVQLQINYADWEDPFIQSGKCYEVAKKHNIPIIVMEPVKGGILATPPESVEKILKEAHPDMSVASWGVRFAADLEGVSMVLSGMSNVAQMQDNIAYMKDFKGLTDKEKKAMELAREEFGKIPLIPCTVCNYCAKVCPLNIGISGAFTARNSLTIYGKKDFAFNQFKWRVAGHGFKNPGECIKCGACEKACPQHIKIRDELEEIAETFKE